MLRCTKGKHHEVIRQQVPSIYYRTVTAHVGQSSAVQTDCCQGVLTEDALTYNLAYEDQSACADALA